MKSCTDSSTSIKNKKKKNEKKCLKQIKIFHFYTNDFADGCGTAKNCKQLLIV